MRTIMSLFLKLEPFFDRYALFLILIFAFLIRLIGLNFGLPYLYHPGELYVMKPVIKFLISGDLNPHRFLWPGSFIMYILAIVLSIILSIYFVYCLLSGQVHNLIEFKKLIRSNPFFYYDVNPVFFHLVGRLLMVASAVITIYLVYLVAKKIFNKSAGLLAAFCLAISPLYIGESRFIRPDVPATMLIMLSFYFLLRFIEVNKNVKWLILSSLSAGFSIATKYTSGVIILPILVYCLIRDFKEIRTSIVNYLVSFLCIKSDLSRALLFTFLGFFIFAPFVVLDIQHALKDIIWIGQGNGGTDIGHARLPGIQNYLWYLKGAAQNGIGGSFCAIFAVLGICLMALKKSYKKYLFIIFPLGYFLAIGFGRLKWDRWFIPVFPFEAILFGVGFYGIYELFIHSEEFQSLKPKISMLFALTLFCVSFPVLVMDIKRGIKLTRTDTRTIAKDWIEDNLPGGSKIAYEQHDPHLHIKPKKDFVLLNMSWKKIVSEPLSYYKERAVDYIIITSYMEGPFYAESYKYPEQISRYRELRTKSKLVKRFENRDNPGPEIEIYKFR